MQHRDRRQDNRRGHEQLRAAREVARTLASVSPIRRRLAPGTVVWARVPYADGTGEKLRPAVVAGVAGDGVAVWRITSSIGRRRFSHTVELEDLDAAGLHRPCGVDVRTPVLLERVALLSVSGELAPKDFLRASVGSCLWALANERDAA